MIWVDHVEHHAWLTVFEGPVPSTYTLESLSQAGTSSCYEDATKCSMALNENFCRYRVT